MQVNQNTTFPKSIILTKQHMAQSIQEWAK